MSENNNFSGSPVDSQMKNRLDKVETVKGDEVDDGNRVYAKEKF